MLKRMILRKSDALSSNIHFSILYVHWVPGLLACACRRVGVHVGLAFTRAKTAEVWIWEYIIQRHYHG